MTTSIGSGLIIGGAVATVVAGVAAYFIIAQPTEQTVETAPAAVLSTTEPVVVETVPAPEPVKPTPEVAVVVQEEAVPPVPEAVATKPVPPSFDLIRVDKVGATVVAGHAAPGSTVELVLEGKVVGRVVADATGAFVALLDLEPSDKPRELSLLQKQETGEDVASVDKVLVMPLKPKAVEAPKLVVAKADTDTVEIIEPPLSPEVSTANTASASSAEPVIATSAPVVKPLSLDTIVYDNLGDVVISGRGSSDGFVRIYLDNKPADIQKVADGGQWKIILSDVPAGLYALRVDSVNSAGAVTQRVLSPFKREAAQTLVASAESPQSNITIQPGFTLWALAKKRYGSGIRYVQIYEANRDRIKDPDLIYPGQVFDLPN